MPLSVSLYQMNSIAGDLSGNSAKIITAAKIAQKRGSKVLLTPEMSLIGYPAEDWLLRPEFQIQAMNAIVQLAKDLEDQNISIPVIVGSLSISTQYRPYNSAFVLKDGKISGFYHKHHLPEYGVFDEERVFTPGEDLCTLTLEGQKFGLSICEDLWYPDIAQDYAREKVDGLFIINASPFEWGKQQNREKTIIQHLHAVNLPAIYVNCIGGQDDLIFDGASFAVDKQGKIQQTLPCFKECLGLIDFPTQQSQQVIDLSLPNTGFQEYSATITKETGKESSIYSALVLATADYVHKNGFQDVVLGLSGGVDSALVASIAVDALGPQHVTAIMMPTDFTTQESLNLAKKQSKLLGIQYIIHPIEPIFDSYMQCLKEDFKNKQFDITEENLQARIRGSLLMAWSNKFNNLVLTTGNKSETAVGYSTLYGDTAGAFAPIKDVYKTEVWKLCIWRNSLQEKERILSQIIAREPSAELRENQKDQDSLPPYDILDNILFLYLEKKRSIQDILDQGYNKVIVQKIICMIHHSEYKRRQSPLGPKISSMNFGKDWRYPIAWQK